MLWPYAFIRLPMRFSAHTGSICFPRTTSPPTYTDESNRDNGQMIIKRFSFIWLTFGNCGMLHQSTSFRSPQHWLFCNACHIDRRALKIVACFNDKWCKNAGLLLKILVYNRDKGILCPKGGMKRHETHDQHGSAGRIAAGYRDARAVGFPAYINAGRR